MASTQSRYMKAKRQSTLEPVFETLTQFMGLRKINTIGIQQANKVMHLSAVAYNIKKYLKFIHKKVKNDLGALSPLINYKIDQIASSISVFRHLIILKTDRLSIF